MKIKNKTAGHAGIACFSFALKGNRAGSPHFKIVRFKWWEHVTSRGIRMKIKAADIARNLNLSKATVSLVLNNKPGVSEKTRRRIFDYIEEVSGEAERQKEEKDKQELENKNIIKVLFIDNALRFLKDFELDVCPDSLTIFEQEARRMGCIISVTYASSAKKEDVERVVREANEENVAGVILYATEMQPDQFPPFRAIRKPMVIYDNDLGNEYHCVTFGGVEGIRDCVDYLVSRGCRNIKYMANTQNIFNFQQRRAGFRAGLRKNGLPLEKESIYPLGETTSEVCEATLKYLETHELPDAFIMENYQISIGVMRALRQKKISVPEDISLLGVDEIPDYLTGDILLTTLRMEHLERAHVAMLFLEQEMKGAISCKFKSFSTCKIIPGQTVK